MIKSVDIAAHEVTPDHFIAVASGLERNGFADPNSIKAQNIFSSLVKTFALANDVSEPCAFYVSALNVAKTLSMDTSAFPPLEKSSKQDCLSLIDHFKNNAAYGVFHSIRKVSLTIVQSAPNWGCK